MVLKAGQAKLKEKNTNKKRRFVVNDKPLFFRDHRLPHNLDRRCSKGSYIASKPDCLGKSKNVMDFSAIPDKLSFLGINIPDKLSFLGINQLNTRKIHPPA